jgi:multiple sugar transport system permease protein
MDKTNRTSAWRRSEQQWDLLLAMPGLMLILVFVLMPLVMAFGMSLTNQRLVSGPNVPTRFIGLENYARLLTDDPAFWQALGHTLAFTAVVVPAETVLGLFLAVLVKGKTRWASLFRTIFFAPFVLPIVVMAAVWTSFYASSAGGGSQGLFNTMLISVSGGRWGPYDWLNDPHLLLPSIILFTIWQGVGFQMVIFLLGLQNIPAHLYEASALDGAGRWQQFRFVTMPLLRNATLFVIVVTTINAFGVFDQISIMARGGGIFQSATTVIYLLVDYGFQQLQLGYASALGVLFLLLVLFLAVIERRVMREERALFE